MTCAGRNLNEIKSFKDNCAEYCSMFDDTDFNPIVDGYMMELRDIAIFIKSI